MIEIHADVKKKKLKATLIEKAAGDELKQRPHKFTSAKNISKHEQADL